MERSSSSKRSAPTPQDDHSRQIFRNNLRGESAWDRHKSYVARYLQVYERDGGKARQARLDSSTRNDWGVLKERHRFLRDEEEGGGSTSNNEYEDEVARRYYNHLFKEFAIADMKHYKSGNLSLRWRSEDDVIDGIGQFTCANTRCEHHRQLQSASTKLTPYEVNFAYEEPSAEPGGGIVNKNALVKIVLCHRCSRKLRYKSDRDRSRRSASPSRKETASSK
jgi:protein FRA10AC1